MTKKAFELKGKVEAVLVARKPGSMVSTSVKKIQVVMGFGVKGDNHAGTRLLDGREEEMLSFGFLKGMEVANHREFSAVSSEEHHLIIEALGLPSGYPSGLYGENLFLSGIPELTRLPSGSMLFFQKGDEYKRTAVLVVWGENTPCTGPGKAIAEHTNHPEVVSKFPKAAMGKRGIVGSVYSSGFIYEGDDVIVKVREQRIYNPF
ncbi:MAG: MOSC domain-containing protein [bacterium]|nr:MOSC domain-containing protein [bacterium]